MLRAPRPMLLPILIAAVSVAAGVLIGLGGQKRSLPALQTLALVAAVTVVLAHLLPDALGQVGLMALLVFAAGAILPSVLEHLVEKVAKGRAANVGLELGYFALLVHKVGDGLGLGAYASHHHDGHAHTDVLLAIAAHTVPMAALVVIVYARRSGTVHALLRGVGLWVAITIGVVIASSVPPALFEPAEPWVTAGVGGLLLHVVAHDWQPAVGRRSILARTLDLAAVALGLLFVLLGGADHHHGEPHVREAMGDALIDLSLETAPALLIGLLIGALLSAFGSRIPSRWLRSGSALRQAIRGAIVGAPLPICACGVLPLAQSLRTRGAGAALVVAFMLATPELGVETFALTVRFMGWPFAWARLGAALLIAVVAALVIHRAVERDRASLPTASLVPEAPVKGSLVSRVLGNFDELLYHVAPWTVVGLIAAAYVQAVLPADALGDLRSFGLDILIVSLVAVPSYVCAASATPLAAVLLLKGMSPGAVLVGLLLGPATNLATVGFLRKAYGNRATLYGVAALLVATWVIAGMVNIADLPLDVVDPDDEDHSHSLYAYGAALLLAFFLLRSIWQTGLRAWLGSLAEGLGDGHHHHVHGHDHGHHHHDHGHHHHDHGHHHHDHHHHDHGHHHHDHGHGHRDHDHDHDPPEPR